MTIDLKQEQSFPAKEVHLMSFAELSTVLAQETKAIKQRPFDELSWRSSSITRIEDSKRVEIKITKLHSELVEKEITELNNKFYNATSELKSLAQILPEIEKIICDYHMLRGLEDNPRKAVLSMENRDGFESAKMQFIKLRTQDSSFTIEEILVAESEFFNGIVIKAKNELPKIQNSFIDFQARISDIAQSCILKFKELEPCFEVKENINEITELNELINQINQNIQCLNLNNCLSSYKELINLVQTIEDYISELVKIWKNGDWVLPKENKKEIRETIVSEQAKNIAKKILTNPETEKSKTLNFVDALFDNSLILKTYVLLARALDAHICYSNTSPKATANLSKIERNYRSIAYQEVESQITEILSYCNGAELITKIRTLAAEDINIDHLESFIKTKYLTPQNGLRKLLKNHNLNEELINRFVDTYSITELDQVVYCLKSNREILPIFISKLESHSELTNLNLVELGQYLYLLKKINGYFEKIDDSTKAYLIPNANTYENIQNLKNYAEILDNLDLDPAKLIKLKNEKDFLKIKSIISDNFSKFNDNEILLTYELLLFAYKIGGADSNSPKKVSDLIKTIKSQGDYHTQASDHFTESFLRLLKELEVAQVLTKTTNVRKEKDCKFKLNLQHPLIIKIKAELSADNEALNQNNDIAENSETKENSTFLLKILPPEKQSLETALEQIMQLFVVINEHDYLLTRAKDYFTLKFHIPLVSNRFLDYARNNVLLKKNQGIKKSFEDFCLNSIQRNTHLLAKQGPLKASSMLKYIEICFEAFTAKNGLHSATEVVDIIMKVQATLIKLAEANPDVKSEDYIILSKFDKNLREDLYEKHELNDRKLFAGISRLIEIFTNEKELNQLLDEVSLLAKLISPETSEEETDASELLSEPSVCLETNHND